MTLNINIKFHNILINNHKSTKKTWLLLSLILITLLFSNFLFAKQHSDISLLKHAISLRQTHQNEQAIAILEGLKVNHKNHKRINIELVINYLTLKQYKKANTVIQHLYLLPLSNKELSKLTALQKRIPSASKMPANAHNFGLRTTLYSGIDSIKSQFPVYEYISDFDWQDVYEVDVSEEDILLNRSEQIDKQRNHYNAAQVLGFYRFTPSKRFKINANQVRFFWSNKISVYRQQIQHKDNYQQLKFDSNFSLLTSSQWLVDIRYRNRSHFYAGKKMLTDNGVQLQLSLPLFNNRLKFGIEKRKKVFPHSLFANNSQITTPWLEYSFNISPKFSASLGSQYRQKKADDPFNSYNNINLYSRVNYQASTNINGYLLLNVNKLHYLKDDPNEVNWSDEQRNSIALGVSYRINKYFSIGLNSHFIQNKLDNNFGEDEWERFEAFIHYQL